ncbi:hypothetical protein EVAR_20750_1 [Eumeta japonica]|uniref:Uncharacterized protein n=1 Tax=Eumeta variegata TaxID=151549 RepID=A0A4C1VAP5_EUMVA|nr:hypothetical protein EVAR_20750_1 [Eumeta japonica]
MKVRVPLHIQSAIPAHTDRPVIKLIDIDSARHGAGAGAGAARRSVKAALAQRRRGRRWQHCLVITSQQIDISRSGLRSAVPLRMCIFY